MDVIETIRYLNSQDGPHMPLRAIAPYCGVDHSYLCRYLQGQTSPKEETRKKMEKGIKELVQEIYKECRWLM